MSTPLAPFTFTGIGQVSKPEPRWNDKAGKAFHALNLTFTKPGSQYPSTISLDCKEEVYNAVVDGSFIEVTASVDGTLGAKGVFNKFWIHKWAAAKPPVASTDELSVEDLERLLAEKKAAAANPAPSAAPASASNQLEGMTIDQRLAVKAAIGDEAYAKMAEAAGLSPDPKNDLPF